MRPGLDQHALDGGGAAAGPDPTASDRLRPFSLRSTERRQDGGAVGGAWLPLSCCASTGATVLCRHVPLFLRRSRFGPAQGSRQTGASPLPVASVTPPACCRSCPVPGDGGAFLRVRCRRYRRSQVSDNRSNLNF